MGIREFSADFLGGVLSTRMAALNARHPWSHNDWFTGWILTELPQRRDRALDVGCGRGELLAALSPCFHRVHGTDVDPGMRAAATARCAGLPNVTVDTTQLSQLSGPFDLVTMVAVLHHLDIPAALADVTRLLRPGGRFLCVGLARPETPVDHAWDIASMITNPVIGLAHHPWPARGPVELAAPDPLPVKDFPMTLAEVSELVHGAMPGAVVRRRLGFRHTIAWTRPEH